MALLSTNERNEYLKALGFNDLLSFQKAAFPNHKDQWDNKYGTNSDNALRTWYNVYKYTKNFKPEEFKCDCGGRYCKGYPTYMKPEVLKDIQTIRSKYGKCTITCGMRDKKYNASLRGSSSTSRHLSGLAIDFYIKGCTDTLAHRKSSIKYMKALPNVRYVYGNGIQSLNGKESKITATNMGNAMHIDCTEAPEVTATEKAYSGTFPKLEATISTSTNNAGALVKIAKELCHPYGAAEKKWAYKTGSPLAAYKTALKTYMGKTAKVSQSDCGYFVNTVVRKSGIDKDFKVLAGTKESFPKVSSKFKVVLKGKKATGLKAGDIIRYKKNRGVQHTLMYIGDGKIAEAGREIRFPVIRKSAKYNDSGVKFSTLEVLRAVEGTTTTTVKCLKLNCKGDNVKLWQEYLNWYFGSTVCAPDGIFGNITNNYTCLFQQKEIGKSAVDGIVGSATLTAAKKVKK